MSERRLVVQRLGYSRAPWRVIDTLTDQEVGRWKTFDHPHIGATRIVECGFDTKAEAIDFMGVLAAKSWDLEADNARLRALLQEHGCVLEATT